MTSLSIPTSRVENTPTSSIVHLGEEASMSKARLGSPSFLESLSPWSAKSQGIQDKAITTKAQLISQTTVVSSSKDAKTCAALVEEVFRPQQPQKSEAEEAALLPRLLNRMNFSMWPQTPEKSLSSEIQSLRGQQGAAAQLLDEIEKEADSISQRLQEKTQKAKHQGNKGFFGLACSSCGPLTDSNEINLQPVRSFKADAIELRPMLRNRIQECEQALVERDAELRLLKHELRLLRSEKEAIRQGEMDAILDGPTNKKTGLLQKYSAAFSVIDATQLQVTFLAWHQHVQRRALRKRMLKQSSLAFASNASQTKALLFASWQTLVRDQREAQKLKKERHRLSIGQTYAAKFALQSNSTTVRSVFIEWWRVSKESALRAHVAAAQAQRAAAAKEESTALTPKGRQAAATDKACCALM